MLNISELSSKTIHSTKLRITRFPKMSIRQNNENDKNNLEKSINSQNIPFSNSNYESVPWSVAHRRTNSFENDETIDQLMLSVINRQTIIMDKLAKVCKRIQVLEIEQQALRSKRDFEKLLNDLESSKTTPSTTTTKKRTKRKQSTVMTMVDETAVREALSKDPLVKRILRMAKWKREKYLVEAKKFFNT